MLDTLEILGNLDLKIFPSPKIQISEVNISRSINEEEHQVASIGEMTASFDLPSLVYAKFKIKSMKFDGLDILIDNENTSVFSNSIAKNKKERENFSNELNANNNTKKNNTTKPFFSVEIDKVSFLDSRLKYLRKNINYEILIDELDISSSYANAYTLDGSIYFQEKKIDIESLLTVDEDIYPLRGKISSDYGVINIQGNLARELKSFDLEIDYYLKSLKNIFKDI